MDLAQLKKPVKKVWKPEKLGVHRGSHGEERKTASLRVYRLHASGFRILVVEDNVAASHRACQDKTGVRVVRASYRLWSFLLNPAGLPDRRRTGPSDHGEHDSELRATATAVQDRRLSTTACAVYPDSCARKQPNFTPRRCW